MPKYIAHLKLQSKLQALSLSYGAKEEWVPKTVPVVGSGDVIILFNPYV